MLENIFKLKENGTSVKTELLAGLATFLTMAYIIVVNPAILSTEGTGMDFGGVFVATIIAACLLYTSPSPRDRTRSRMPSSA